MAVLSYFFIGISSTGGKVNSTRAFIAPAGSLQAFDFDPAHPSYNSTANAISENSLAVGSVDPGPCPPLPILCSGALTHTIPVQFVTFTEADAINDLGQVVGHAVSPLGGDQIVVLAAN